MTAPRLEIDLDKIQHNARTLVDRLGARGISVTGVTKAALGAPEVAAALIRAGVRSLGDSRIENIATMRKAGITAPIMLIRSPMPSPSEQVVAQADISVNTELDVVSGLSQAARAAGRTHGVVLMVELGDLREGIMPGDLQSFVEVMLAFPNIVLRGIGTNLACRNGVVPDARNMAELSALADSIDAAFGHRLGCKPGHRLGPRLGSGLGQGLGPGRGHGPRPPLGFAAGSVATSGLEIVSGGNSANLDWALSGADAGRINDLRLGEAILLGCEPLYRRPIDGLYTDAFTLVGEVIERKVKPTIPSGALAQSAFGERTSPVADRVFDPAASPAHFPRTIAPQITVMQTILALGRQDIDSDGLLPPTGMKILGASSDHLIVDSGHIRLSVGAEVRFQLNYGALLRAMTSPFVAKVFQPAFKPVFEQAFKTENGRAHAPSAMH
jgi:predicted amino acid racemase